jgi:short subunit dehydrogenase-like uncharacterized protein
MATKPRPVLVYGAYGFTGRIVLESLAERGIEFIVAGRNAGRVEAVAAASGAGHRVFDLDDVTATHRALSNVSLLLNAAGPFGSTAAPLLRACLRKRVHYLDVSGEVVPLEYAASLDAEAVARGVMILPGVGFDVVPSDCLAVHLAKRLPGATSLVLGIAGLNLLSRGSAYTFAEHAGLPVYVRKDGRLEPMRFRTQMRWLEYGHRRRPSIAVSWGDLVTAFRSTGIPDIEVYFEATFPRWLGVTGNQYFGWMYRSQAARAWLNAYASTMPDGPTLAERRAERVVITGEASVGRDRVRATVATPEAYSFTGIAASAVIEQVLAGAVKTGFQTPGTLLGADFVLSLDGVERKDLS